MSDQKELEQLQATIDQLERKLEEQDLALHNSEELLYAIVDMFPQSICWKDQNSVFMGGNAHFRNAVGFPERDDLIGLTDYDLPFSPNAASFVADDQDVMRANDGYEARLAPLERPGDEKRLFEVSKVPLRNVKGDVVGTIGRYADVTQKLKDASTIKQQLATIEATIDGVGYVKEGKILYANPSFYKLFGCDDASQIINRDWFEFYARMEQNRFDRTIKPKLKSDGFWRGEALAKRADGSLYAQGVSLTLTEDRSIICVCRDISDLKAAQQQIARNALHDDLTGLPNRRLLIERLELAISQSQREADYEFAVLFLDLDRFKIINDSLGHQVGDKLLIDVANKLSSGRRATDLIARIGGDEFVILLSDVKDGPGAAKVAEDIVASFAVPTIIDGRKIFSGTSIGVVMSSQRYTRADQMLRDADIAMYRAKREALSGYKFFDEVMFHQIRERLTIETDLRHALKAEELTVHYQPIVNINDKRIDGCEALVRWNHPKRGMVPPDQFITIAEESGLINDIDQWVLRRACRQLARWQLSLPGAAKLKVNVNVSSKCLRHDSLVDRVIAALSRAGLDGSSLCLELTESVLVDDFDATAEILRELAQLNVRISIDDFGTGYSSFNYLHKLPVHNLKIDRSFIGQMEDSQNSYKVASVIIALSEQLGLNVVAEGIETERQMSLLQQLGCKYGQGYFLAKPMSVPDFEALMHSTHGQLTPVLSAVASG